jgi:hypothetical protein
LISVDRPLANPCREFLILESLNQDLVLEPEQFGVARAADYRIRLPLAHLDPGDYLFEVEAKSGAPQARRTLRFSIGDAAGSKDPALPSIR